MYRSMLGVLVILALFLGQVGNLVADEGTVVKMSKGILIVKVGDKDEKISLRGVRIVDAQGKQLRGKALAKALKQGAKVDIKKKGNKIAQIVVQ